jgi:hypothetical protein
MPVGVGGQEAAELAQLEATVGNVEEEIFLKNEHRSMLRAVGGAGRDRGVVEQVGFDFDVAGH